MTLLLHVSVHAVEGNRGVAIGLTCGTDPKLRLLHFPAFITRVHSNTCVIVDSFRQKSATGKHKEGFFKWPHSASDVVSLPHSFCLPRYNGTFHTWVPGAEMWCVRCFSFFFYIAISMTGLHRTSLSLTPSLWPGPWKHSSLLGGSLFLITHTSFLSSFHSLSLSDSLHLSHTNWVALSLHFFYRQRRNSLVNLPTANLSLLSFEMCFTTPKLSGDIIEQLGTRTLLYRVERTKRKSYQNTYRHTTDIILIGWKGISDKSH